jgi:phage gp36-like protein
MANTVTTSATGYATVADLFNFKDWRQIADWCTDTEIRPTRPALSDPTTPVGAVVAELLLSASGEVESACLVGKRYTPAELASLTGSTKRLLVAVVCAITLYRAAERRNPLTAPKEVPGYQAAKEQLELLRKGEAVFGLSQQMEAGIGPSVTPLVSTDGSDERRTVSQARRFFGDRDRG